jgi:precorrin-6B methylase 2
VGTAAPPLFLAILARRMLVYMEGNDAMAQGNSFFPEQMPPARALHLLLAGMGTARALQVAAQLRVADQLKDGPKNISQLAADTGTHASSLHRLLRALTSLGVFVEVQDGTFAHTPLSQLLQTDVPGSLHSIAMLQGEPSQWNAWGDLAYSVQTGLPAFDHVHGEDVWTYLASHPEAARIFNEAMVGFTEMAVPAIQAYDFTPISTLVDVGGGYGALLIKILTAYPQMRGSLIDHPAVIEEAQRRITAAGLAPRCELVSGSFFVDMPKGADAYLLKQILHTWDDQHCIEILQQCRQAMSPDGKVLVLEQVRLPGQAVPTALLQDLQMLAVFSGHERTEQEFRTLFASASLRLTQVITSPTPYSIIEAVAV